MIRRLPSPPATATGLVGLTLTVSCLYFFSGGGWNQASHFAFVRALIEQGSIRIDDYHGNTGDKAFRDGHFYTNKAPGTGALSAPFAGLARLAAWAVGSDPRSERALSWQARAAILGGATLPLVAAAWALSFIAIRLGASARAAGFAAIVYGLGTPAWVYGSSLWAHSLTAACLIGALAATLAISETGLGRRDLALGAGIGLACGSAVAADYMSGGAAAILAGFAIWKVGRDDRPRGLRLAAAVALGALPPALLLGIYHQIAFGSPWKIAYGFAVGFEGVREGMLGVTYPKPGVAAELLVGSHRGLLRVAPVLAGGLIGLGGMLLRRNLRGPAAAALAVFLFHLLFNASYHYWWGGNCYGPRFLTGALPFLCLGAAFAWDAWRVPARMFLLSLGCAGIFWTLVAISTHPMPRDSYGRPFEELLWPSFVEGKLSLNQQDAFVSTRPSPAYNWGERIGLKGLPSLIPLGVFWALMIGAWILNERREGWSPARAAPNPPADAPAALPS